MARTAVVAVTATAVSNRVSRRRGRRWTGQNERLGELRTAGVLPKNELATQKARILAGAR
jgi:hypothetical protein